jgi:alkylhydroperoxidase family enzyme
LPNVLRTLSDSWRVAFREAMLEHSVKELCRLYVSKSVECEYRGSQRSLKGRQQGVTENDVDELLEFEPSDRYDERQKAALAYTSALVWASRETDDEV